MIALLDRTHLSFIVDHPVVAKQWSDAMMRAGKQVDVLVKVDVGFHRCGIDPDAREAMPMIKAWRRCRACGCADCCRTPGQAYHAHSEDELRTMAEAEARTMSDLAERCRKNGVPVEEISAGATPPARFSLQQDGFTEYRPGNYVYFDRTQVALGAATIDDCALTVLATVVSKPAANRIILDSGSKTLTNDGARRLSPAPRVTARVDRPSTNLLIERLSEEHATVRVLSGSTELEPGDRVRIIPNHSCVVSNLVDQAWLVEGDGVEPLPIAARGTDYLAV